MEKYLDEKGVFNEFQVEFKVLSGEEWMIAGTLFILMPIM